MRSSGNEVVLVAFVVGLFEAEAVRGADQELLGDDGGAAATSGHRPVLGVDGQKYEPKKIIFISNAVMKKTEKRIHQIFNRLLKNNASDEHFFSSHFSLRLTDGVAWIVF